MSRKANNLTGKEWLKNSISIWRDLARDEEEQKIKHPAMFPKKLVELLCDCFLFVGDTVPPPLIFDPFLGSGTSLLVAAEKNINGLGFELNPDYYLLANERLEKLHSWVDKTEDLTSSSYTGIHNNITIKQGNALELSEQLPVCAIDLTITSPPYWDILNQKRTADKKTERTYSDSIVDLGNISDYSLFLEKQRTIITHIFEGTKPKGYLVMVVMDIRKKNRFYPLHIDIINQAQLAGFSLDDIIIWDRGGEYNNLKPLGFPYVFRINKVHEYILIFQKTNI